MEEHDGTVVCNNCDQFIAIVLTFGNISTPRFTVKYFAHCNVLIDETALEIT